MYSELLKVPFMIRLPHGEGARRTQAIVQFHDVLPTLLDLLGMANSATAMKGRSFLPVLHGETDAHRKVIITGYHEAPDRCVRDQTWSYVERPVGEPDELYDLVDDPSERSNLIDQFPQEARRLAGALGTAFRLKSQPGVSGAQVKGIQGKYELASSGIE
jgi:arylsulfatase A-like enzyme